MAKRNRNPANDGHGDGDIRLELPSGFTVSVRPMPPYYLDIIEDALPAPEYPRRKIVNVAGDVFWIDYDPKPGMELNEGDEDYDLWLQWQAVNQDRERIEHDRRRARMDFLLANCVTILDGPIDFHSDEWIENIEAPFDGYVAPEHPGKRKVIFIKAHVLNDAASMELVMQAAISEEVTMQGVYNSLRRFRDRAGP